MKSGVDQANTGGDGRAGGGSNGSTCETAEGIAKILIAAPRKAAKRCITAAFLSIKYHPNLVSSCESCVLFVIFNLTKQCVPSAGI